MPDEWREFETMTVYVREQGAKISRVGKKLLVCGATGETALYAGSFSRLALFGAVHVSQPALRLAMEENIDVIFFSQSGRYLGRLVGALGENSPLARAQFVLSANPEEALKIARPLIRGKLRNQSTSLKRWARERDDDKLRETGERLDGLAVEALEAGDAESLRGVEGAGAELYFASLPRVLLADWGFHGRKRRPPEDPLNALLSFLYALLYTRARAAAIIAGLDPRPGCLHSLEYGRDSLPLDLMEEFRPWPCDALAVSLLNKRHLRAEDFERREDKPGAVLLRPEALKTAVAAFETRMNETLTLPDGSEKSLFEIMVSQAEIYRKAVEGASQYAPFLHK